MAGAAAHRRLGPLPGGQTQGRVVQRKRSLLMCAGCSCVLQAIIVLSLAALTWTYSPVVPWGVTWQTPVVGRSSLRSAPAAWRTCRRGAAALSSLSMKDGPIGRGRGAMSQEQFEQAQAQITASQSAPAKTPEEARRNSRVVGAGEISPSQPTRADDAFLRTKGAYLI